MQYREMRLDDTAEVLEVRTSTRENRLTTAELLNIGVTPESVAHGLKSRTKGWVCIDSGHIVGFTIGDGGSGEVMVLALLPEAEGKGIGRDEVRARLVVFEGA